MTRDIDRRSFIKTTGLAALASSSVLSARSYGRILGANDRVNFAAVGVHGRGRALIKAVAQQKNVDMLAICDVDQREFERGGTLISEEFNHSVKNYVDFRKLVENKDVDALLIATPEHWHAPMTIMGVQNDKHVFVEKPCSHNPHEGELLVAAQKKFKKVIQMGNQQRSAPTSIQAIKEIRDGIIGRPYLGEAWYANTRGSIGRAKAGAIPDWLNWELWQGPAPRESYKDIYVHYDWHWFTKYGTGEINNNGTHEIDICRWALDVKFPSAVSSNGGRFHFDDDWQFFDTQNVNYEFGDDKMITWQGRSCNGLGRLNRGRGATIHGTEGSIFLSRNQYTLYDLKGNEIKTIKEAKKSATLNTVGAGNLDILHMQNFVNAIRVGEKQNSPIDEGAASNLLCHLGNYAQMAGKKLAIDEKTGRILDKKIAKKYWRREYAKGWEPKV